MTSYHIFDIAVNPTYYNESKLNQIITNAKKSNILPLFIGVDMTSNKKIIDLSYQYQTMCYCGIHPTHINVPYNNENIETILDIVQVDLKNLILNNLNIILCIGECGLDYFRNQNYDLQKKVFIMQLDLYYLNLPYFLHMRNSFDDFYNIVKNYKNIGGVVHSFDGTLEQALKLINLGFYIGINGCSMRSNIDVVKYLPLNKILVETDSPFCLIRKNYLASQYTEILKIKENEPLYISNIILAISNIKQLPYNFVLNFVKSNTLTCFPRLKKFQ